MAVPSWENEMQIQINLRLKTIPEMEAVEPKISTLRIYNANSWRHEEPRDLNLWHNPLFRKTTMGVLDGSQIGYITEVTNYLGTTIYAIIRIMPQDV